MYSVSGKIMGSEPAELPPSKTEDKVKYTNRSGTTFTVDIVPQQMIKNTCPICQEKTITANPVCIENRHHVVCQACAPKIIFSENSRCPVIPGEYTTTNLKCNQISVKK